jgi:3-dehydroquinate synthase
MVVAARLSERVCGLPANDTNRLRDLLAAFGLPTEPPRLAPDKWLELMGRDKKVTDGAIRFVLLEALGLAVIRDGVAREELAETLAS